MSEERETDNRPAVRVVNIIGNAKDACAKLLANEIAVERFLRICATKVNANDKLQIAALNNPTSLLAAIMEAAQLGLDYAIPNEVFLIPYKGVVTNQSGYKGLQKLATRDAFLAGDPIKHINPQVIYEKDLYERQRGQGQFARLTMPPFGEDRGEIVGFFASCEYKSGRFEFLDMTKLEVTRHMDRFCKSKEFKSSPWSDKQNFWAYGCKTVLRLLVYRQLEMSPATADFIKREIEIETGRPYGEIDEMQAMQEPTESEALNERLKAAQRGEPLGIEQKEAPIEVVFKTNDKQTVEDRQREVENSWDELEN